MIIFETKKVTIPPLIKFQFSNNSLKLNGLRPPILFGIEIAPKILEKAKTNIADKAKPRVIVGRKATGPKKVGIAGLPKQNEFCGPWSMLLTRAIFLEPGFRKSSMWRRDDAKGKEENFKGMFILPRC
jgi:hypothetical protein